jgi:hypothetical protein
MLPVAARPKAGQGADETELRFLRLFGVVLEWAQGYEPGPLSIAPTLTLSAR